MINLGDGKSKLDTYLVHQAVWTGTAFLATLSAMEWPVGMAETIKFSVVESAKTFVLLEAHCQEFSITSTLSAMELPVGMAEAIKTAAALASGQRLPE